MPHKFTVINRQFARGRCPYQGGWKSGLDRRIIWPLVEVHVGEDNGLCHTKCACVTCSTGLPPLGPHTDPSAIVLTGSEIDHLNSMDCLEIAAFYDIHAPINAGRSTEPLAGAPTDPHALAPGPGEELEVFEGDWQVPTQLCSTFAPLHRGHLGEGDAVDTP